MRRANVLLLCDDAARHTGTVNEHIVAFKNHSAFRIVVLNSRAASSLEIDFSHFDAIIFHYSIVISSFNFLPPLFFQQLSKFKGPKVLFIQDEYRWVDRTAAAVRDLGISVVFTVVNHDVIRQIYKAPWFDKIRFEQTLTGFVPTELLGTQVPDYAARQIDVSYRARRVPSWLGSFGQEKWIIGEKFLNDSARFDLKCDIDMSESSRIYGQSWINFVSNSRAVLGTESGASFIDFSGSIQEQVEEYERHNADVTFENIQKRFLHRDGQTVIHVISPRCFEAAALRTLMILYPGDYSGILEARRHYVPLLRDHSNMDEVVSFIRDPAWAGPIIKAAYDEIASSPRWTFKAFVTKFDKVIAEELEKSSRHNSQILKQSMNASIDLDSEFCSLEKAAADSAKARIMAMRMALWAQRVSQSTGRVVHRVLPAALAASLVKIGSSASARVKPLAKRILFGRSN